MALYLGDTLISGSVEGQQLNLPFSLFEYQFTDHLLNNASWLRADTFSWQSGAVYVSAYAKLVEEYATGTTQTEDGVTYKLTTNGFKIAEADQESAIASLYASTGKAWFYILDAANQRFKLPRELPFDGQAKGNEMTLGITNSGVNVGLEGDEQGVFRGYAGAYGANIRTTAGPSTGVNAGYFGITTDPTKSGIISNRAITDSQKYLYFYVGETVNNANLINAGVIEEALNDKADTDMNNVTATGKETVVGWGTPDYDSLIDVVSSAYANSGTGYRPTKDGILMVMGRNNGGTCSYFIYDSNGTLVRTSFWNITAATSGTLSVLPVSKDYSYRFWQFSDNVQIIFVPYRGV